MWNAFSDRCSLVQSYVLCPLLTAVSVFAPMFLCLVSSDVFCFVCAYLLPAMVKRSTCHTGM